uniref:Uncharacterized protein n=1 Tax=Anguilla anguilla TaxID=7936 RepID=A0A0E9RVM1_ANGAN
MGKDVGGTCPLSGLVVLAIVVLSFFAILVLFIFLSIILISFLIYVLQPFFLFIIIVIIFTLPFFVIHVRDQVILQGVWSNVILDDFPELVGPGVGVICRTK